MDGKRLSMKKFAYAALLVSLLAVCGFWFIGCGPQHPYTSGGRTATDWAEVLRQPDVAARRKAAEKIGPLLLTDPTALLLALEALKDEDVKVRLSAIRSLRFYAGRHAAQAIAALQEVQKNDTDPAVRVAAAKAIDTLTHG